jgi:protein O-mannosyl-transferase
MSKKRLRTNSVSSRWMRISVCIFLVGITWLVFGQTLWHGFINYDDPVYLYENPVVKSGLTLHGIGWIFTHNHGSNWHPLTSISYMVDCQFYGLKAGGHHFTNVLLHTIGVLLLFVLLCQMTGALWRSAFVAAVFAIHPLHVESVAWVAERKDVLSGVFFMLTLMAYVRYARGPTLGRYAMMLVLFACGLMAKSMLVTVPFILLLLDYWPLGRFSQRTRIRQLIREKIPLLVLSAASCAATLFVQRETVASFERLPLVFRINNALVSCFTYVWQLIWPVNLVPFYPHPVSQVPFWEIAVAAGLLVTIMLGAVTLFRKYPYLITGWLWYLVMLVPVIGVIQVGSQAHADRYTYLPQIGLYFAFTWGAADFFRSWRIRREILVGGAIILVLALSLRAWHQTSYWRESESLWAHALAVNSNNDIAHAKFAEAMLSTGRIDEAILHYRRLVEIRSHYPENDRLEPYYSLGNALLQKNELDEAIVVFRKALEAPFRYSPEAHSGLGNALLQKGEIEEAIFHFEKFVQLRPDHAEAYYNLGGALLREERVDEAITQYEKALKLGMVWADLENNLGNALLRKGEIDGAVLHFQKFLKLCTDKKRAEGNFNLGIALFQKGQISEAIAHYREAVKLQPDYAEAQNNLAAVLLQEGEVDEAISLWEKVLKLRPNYVKAHLSLANALLQKGKTEEATAHFGKALQIEPRSISVLNQWAWVLATNSQAQIRNGAKAIELAQQADQISGGQNPIVLRTLAAAYAEDRQFAQAIETVQKALELATTQGNTNWVNALQKERALYQGNSPYHEAPQ